MLSELTHLALEARELVDKFYKANSHYWIHLRLVHEKILNFYTAFSWNIQILLLRKSYILQVL